MLTIRTALVAAAILAVAPANAAIVSGQFTGVVTGESYADAVFGVAPGTLVGMPLTGTFSYDTALLGTPQQTSPVTYFWTNASASQPTLTMTTTVNNTTISYGGAYVAIVFTNHDTSTQTGPGDGEIANPWQEFGIETCNFTTYGYACGVLDIGAQDDSVHIVGDPSNPAVSFNLNGFPPGDGIGEASVQTANCPGPACIAQWGFSITSIATVPEPTSLALLGAALLGLSAVRRRRPARGALFRP